jgi:transposase
MGWAPRAGRLDVNDLTGETLRGLSKRHDIGRNLIRVWVQKYEVGDFDEDAGVADLLQQYEARIAALERLVGKQALELELLKGALKRALSPCRTKSATGLRLVYFQAAANASRHAFIATPRKLRYVRADAR